MKVYIHQPHVPLLCENRLIVIIIRRRIDAHASAERHRDQRALSLAIPVNKYSTVPISGYTQETAKGYKDISLYKKNRRYLVHRLYYCTRATVPTTIG